MDNNIFLTSGKGEHFEFQLSVNGISANDAQVRFVLKSDPFHMMFPCTHTNGETWTLELPKMGFLEPTTYQFVIEAVVDGYFFEAHSGTVTVTKSPEVYVRKDDVQLKVRNTQFTNPVPVTTPEVPTPVAEPAVTPDSSLPPVEDKFKQILDRLKNSVAKPEEAEKEEKKEEVKETESVVSVDPLADAKKIADQILSEATPTPATPKKEKKVVAKKDNSEKVRAIISETKKDQAERKQRELLRQKRLNEQAQEKLQASKVVPTPAPVVENVTTINAEKDAVARAILESSKKSVQEESKPSIVFKKGETVTK